MKSQFDIVIFIAWSRSEQNIADNLTRHDGKDILRKALGTGRLDFSIEQWIFLRTMAIATNKGNFSKIRMWQN